MKSGGRWIDVPVIYRPRKTLHNRFARWRAICIWQRLFAVLTATGGSSAELLRDSTHIKAHRSKQQVVGRLRRSCRVTAQGCGHGGPRLQHQRHTPVGRKARRCSEHSPEVDTHLGKLLQPVFYRGCNVIERMLCRLKDYCQIASRHDKHATSFASTVGLADAIT